MFVHRILSILLLSIYSLFSTGLVVHAHYCQEELAAVQLYTEAACCCDDNQSVPESDDCCKNEIKTLKIADAQLKVEPRSFADESSHFDAIPALGSINLCYSRIGRKYEYRSIDTNSFHPPDIASNCPLYIRYQRLVLYS